VDTKWQLFLSIISDIKPDYRLAKLFTKVTEVRFLTISLVTRTIFVSVVKCSWITLQERSYCTRKIRKIITIFTSMLTLAPVTSLSQLRFWDLGRFQRISSPPPG